VIHENSLHGDDQHKINEHIVYLHRCAKLSLPVYANSLTEDQRRIARDYLQMHLKSARDNK